MSFTTYSSAISGVLLLTSALVARGQEAVKTSTALGDHATHVGFRAGYSKYRMTGSEADLHTTPYRVQYSQGSVVYSDENRPVQWFTVGAVLRKQLYKPLAFQTELTYLREGGVFKNSPGGGFLIDKGSYTVDCLQIPALLNLTLLAAGPLALHLEGGIALNVIVSGVDLDQAHLHPSNKFNDPNTILAPIYGAELTLKRQKVTYLLNLRYSNDLADFYQREYIGTHYNLRSAGFSINTGILFGQAR